MFNLSQRPARRFVYALCGVYRYSERMEAKVGRGGWSAEGGTGFEQGLRN
jgi:hypothetical protein